MKKTNCPNLAKNLIILLILSLIFAILFSSSIYALSSDNINLQGKIVRNDTGHEGMNVIPGSPACVVNGPSNDTCDFRVSYYTALTGGTLLLTEDFTNVEIGQFDGVFELSLGSGTVTTTLQCRDGTCNSPSEVISEYGDLYVELQFAPDGSTLTETFTRMPLEASPYAIFSKFAEGAHDAFKLSTSVSNESLENPSAGMIYFDTGSSQLKVYNGAEWQALSAGTSSSLWTDAGTYSYLTSTTDDLVLGGSSFNTGRFVFDMDGGSGSYFDIFNNDHSNKLFTILSSGNVGIGTATPGAKLEVGGTVSTITNSTGNLTISTGGGNGNILLMPNGTGNVGIGTTNPTEKLEVNGTIRVDDPATGIIADLSLTRPYYGRLNYAVTPNNGKSEVRFVSKGATSGTGQTYFVVASTEIGDTGNNLLMGVASGRTFITNALNYSTAGTLHIGGVSWAGDGVVQVSGVPTDATGKMTVMGNVGIGTTSPAQKLDVLGGIKLGTTSNINNVLDTQAQGGAPSGNLYWGNAPLLTSANLGSFGVTSISNSDGTLTISPTVGNVIASLNLNNANTWTGIQTFTSIAVDNIFNTSGNISISPASNILSISGLVYQTGLGGSTYFGENAGRVDDLSNNYNTGIGYNSLYSNTTGYFNTALGPYSLYSNTTGSSNTALGSYSLRTNSTGSYNIALGYFSLYSNTEGIYNTAVGNNSLYTNTEGYFNTALGNNSLFSNVTGDSNTAVGYASLYSSTEGYFNTAVGHASLDFNTTGSSNTALGAYSLYSNTTGDSNTAVGHEAGRYQADGTTALTDPENSIYIGYNAKGKDNNDNNSIVIGYNAIGLGANTVVLGNDSIVTTALKGSVGIGTTTPRVLLDVSGTRSNTISYSTAIAGIGGADVRLQIGTLNGSPNYGVWIQSERNYEDTVFPLLLNPLGGNVGIGTNTPQASLSVSGLVYQTGLGGSTYFGENAGRVDDLTDNYNTGIGYNSLYSNTTGYFNTALGPYSLYSNTTGYSNTALGYDTLYSNTSGNYNTALGYASLYSNTSGGYNTALGYYSLYSNTTGYYNTALGYRSLYSNTTGYYNTALGAYSLYSNTTGSSNTALGYRAGRYQADGSTALTDPENSIYIGYNAKGKDNNDNNSIVIGYNAIGLGANTVVLGNDSIVTTALKGSVGIGVTSPAYRLQLPNTADNAGKGQANAWVTYSDISLKENIQTISGGLNKIMALRGVTFDWKGQGVTSSGFIAQEVEPIIPDLVSTDSNGIKSLDYGRFTPYLVEAIKEQQLQIQTAYNRIEQLENINENKIRSITTPGWYRISKLDTNDDHSNIKINNTSVGSSQNIVLSIDSTLNNQNINIVSNLTTGGYDITKARINNENGIKYLEIYIPEVNENKISVKITESSNWITTDIVQITEEVNNTQEYALNGILFGISDKLEVEEDNVKIAGDLLSLSVNSSIGDSANRWNDIYAKGTIRLGSGADGEGAIRFNVQTKTLEFSNNGVEWLSVGDLSSQMTISPEYAGAILFADGSDNSGIMTSDAVEEGGSFKNYYEWVSNKDTPQDYDILVRITLPADFLSWKEDAIYLDFMTENSVNTDNNSVGLSLIGNSGTDVQISGGISKIAGAWERMSIKGADITQCNSAGGTCTLRISLTSSMEYFTRVGDITLNYNRSL